jgi:CheY-like chemotaxis protein
MTDADRDGALPHLNGLKILLAEDSDASRMVTTEMLLAMGAEVRLAHDGAEALEMLAAEAYDAVLLDIEMPKVSGLDVIRTVRGGGGVQAARPMLALTAYAREDHGDAIFAAGADALLCKPVPDIAALGHAILAAIHPGALPGALPGAPLAAAMIAARDADAVRAVAHDGIDLGVLRAIGATVGAAHMDELLAKLIDDIGRGRAAITAAAAARDAAAMRAPTHGLAGLAGVIGARRLHALARHVFAAANDDASYGAIRAEDTARLTEEIDAVLAVLARERA